MTLSPSISNNPFLQRDKNRQLFRPKAFISSAPTPPPGPKGSSTSTSPFFRSTLSSASSPPSSPPLNPTFLPSSPPSSPPLSSSFLKASSTPSSSPLLKALTPSSSPLNPTLLKPKPIETVSSPSSSPEPVKPSPLLSPTASTAKTPLAKPPARAPPPTPTSPSVSTTLRPLSLAGPSPERKGPPSTKPHAPRGRPPRPPTLMNISRTRGASEALDATDDAWGVGEETDFTPKSHCSSPPPTSDEDEENWDNGLDGESLERSAQTDKEGKDFGLHMTAFKKMSLPLLRQQIFLFFKDIFDRCSALCTQLEEFPLLAFQTLLKGLEANGQAALDPGIRKDFEKNIQVCRKNIELMESSSSIHDVPCVRKAIEQLHKFRDTISFIMKGFQEDAVGNDRLDALPSTLSNAEGLEVMTRIIRALHSVIDWEGGKTKDAAKLTLKFQKFSNTLLEDHNVEDLRWKKEI